MLHISNATRVKNHKNYLRKLTQKRRSIEKRQNRKLNLWVNEPNEVEIDTNLHPDVPCTCGGCDCEAHNIMDSCVCEYCPQHC